MEKILFNCCPNGEAPDWKRFNALEISGCRDEAEEGADETCIGSGYGRDEAEFFCIFGHLIEGGCEPITDVPTYQGAENIAAVFALQTGFAIHVYC